jgi:hypothetical protein
MAVDTIENTTKGTRGKSRRGRALRSKARARKAAHRRHIANLRVSAEQVLRQQDWTDGTPRRFARIRLPRRSDFHSIAKASPLILGAIGLGMGLILASIVPKRISARLRRR